jgi:hypothetical protein
MAEVESPISECTFSGFTAKTIGLPERRSIDRREALLHPLNGLRPLGKVEKPLEGCGVLDDQVGLAVNGQHCVATCFPQPAEELRSLTLEIRKRMNVLTTIDEVPD